MSASAVGDRSVQPAAQPLVRPAAETWFSWTGAIALLVLVVWLIPIKAYTLPVHLPFSLELYRLLLIFFVLAWIVAAAAGKQSIAAGGFAKPLILIGCVGVLSDRGESPRDPERRAADPGAQVALVLPQLPDRLRPRRLDSGQRGCGRADHARLRRAEVSLLPSPRSTSRARITTSSSICRTGFRYSTRRTSQATATSVTGGCA